MLDGRPEEEEYVDLDPGADGVSHVGEKQVGLTVASLFSVK